MSILVAALPISWKIAAEHVYLTYQYLFEKEHLLFNPQINIVQERVTYMQGSSLIFLDTLWITFLSPSSKMHRCSNDCNFFASLLVDRATICSLFSPCVACVTPLCMKATFGTTFSSSPKLCLHYRGYEANHLYGVNTWYSPSGKKKAQEKLLKQYEKYEKKI